MHTSKANTVRPINSREWNQYYKCSEDADAVLQSLRTTASELSAKTRESIRRNMQVIKEQPRTGKRTRGEWKEMLDDMRFSVQRAAHQVKGALNAQVLKKRKECEQEKKNLQNEQQRIIDAHLKDMKLEEVRLIEHMKEERRAMRDALSVLREDRDNEFKRLDNDCRDDLDTLQTHKKTLPSRRVTGQKNLGI